MSGRVKMSSELKKNIYGGFDKASQQKAMKFYSERAAKMPHHEWMEETFLKIAHDIQNNKIATQIAPELIKAPDINDPNCFARTEDFGREQERLQEIGKATLQNGDLIAIDMAGGMATGFGGTSKAVVKALIDARYNTESGVTYLDIKRYNYLSLQIEAKRHFIAAELVSDATEKDIIENLEKFAERNKKELVLIREGASLEEVKEIWGKYKDRWEDTLIVPIIKQPTMLEISKDGKSVGNEYMKGHGDFFQVIKHQMRHVMEVTGAKYAFSSNIDNTGALVSRTILGYFVEQVQQNNIEAMMEAAEKFEGDKGGVPAMIDGKLMVLEGAYVPKEWKEAFLGRTVFPYMNTNTFWWACNSLLEKEFDLPVMDSSKPASKWCKMESIMAHGLASLIWKTLVVNRGLRFLPAKFLTDLWIGRSDYMRWFKGKLMPVQMDGKYVQKPLVEISKSTISKVDDLDGNIFAGGSYDSMKYLNLMMIGGEGKHFMLDPEQDRGHKYRFLTNCAVSYEGNIAVIYEYRENMAPGTLVIEGKSESDEITLKNSVIFVPAGKTVEINKSVIDHVDPNVTKDMLKVFLANATTWTDTKKEEVLNSFFPAEEIPQLVSYLNEEVISRLTDTSKESAQAILQLFRADGAFAYKTRIEGEKVFLKVDSSTKCGNGKGYKSGADENEVPASTKKALVIRSADRIFIKVAGGEMTMIGVPKIKDGQVEELHMFLGKINEQFPSDKKPELLKGKFERVLAYCAPKDQKKKDRITDAFKSLSWGLLLELNHSEIATEIEKILNKQQSQPA